MYIKRITALMLIIVFAFAIFTACKSEKEDIYAQVELTNVYKTQYLEAPDGYTFNQTYVFDEKFYISYLKTEYIYKNDLFDKAEFYQIFHVYNISGEFLDVINFDSFKNAEDTIVPSSDETFYVLNAKEIKKITNDGTVILEVNIEELFEIESLKVSTYPIQLICDENYLYVFCRTNSIFYIITPEGEPVHYFKVKDHIMESQSNIITNIDINKTPDGKIIFAFQSRNYYAVDVENKKITEYEMPSILGAPAYMMNTYYDATNSNEYDIYYKTDSGFFGYNFEEEQIELLVDWTNSDIFGLYCNVISIITPDIVLCTLMDDYKSRGKPVLLMRIPDDEVIPKTIITLAADKSQLLMSRVVTFNRQSDEYRVVIDNYSIESYNLDIASGVVHDLVFLSPLMPMDSYINKGMFVNLYDFFESDPDISSDILLGMLRSKYETDGRLYIIPIAYYVVTLLGKQSIVGAKESLTIDEIMETNKNLSPEMSLFTYNGRDQAFSYMLQASANNYVDYKNAKCNFESAEFIKMIEFAKTLPETALTTKSYIEPNEKMDMIRNNQSYFHDLQIMELYDLVLMSFYYGEDDYVIKGFPNQTRNGTIVECYNHIGINAKSKNKEGAWEFVKYWLLNESELDGLQMTTLPVTTKALQSMLDEYMNKYYYRMSMGISMYDNPTTSDYEQYYFTEQDAEKITRFFNNMQVTPKYDNTVIRIIQEEITPFFAGAITAEKCASYIQNRVSTYLNEQK